MSTSIYTPKRYMEKDRQCESESVRVREKEKPCINEPPKNGKIALWPNTRVVKCKYRVSQKQIGLNNGEALMD